MLLNWRYTYENFELAVQYGKWVLLGKCSKITRCLIRSNFSSISCQNWWLRFSGIIQIGDKSLSYNNAFKFFMTTTLPNPHYSPETFVKVTIINFAITPSGL
jgi:dynein heavy chain